MTPLALQNKPDDKVQLRRWQLAHVLISRPVQLSVIYAWAARETYSCVGLDRDAGGSKFAFYLG